MREIEVPIPQKTQSSTVERAVEQVCAELDLRIALHGTLSSHPGSLHWHLKRGKERGTLEITFAPRATRLWLSVHSGRDAGWIDAALRSLPEMISIAIRRIQPVSQPPLDDQGNEG